MTKKEQEVEILNKLDEINSKLMEIGSDKIVLPYRIWRGLSGEEDMEKIKNTLLVVAELLFGLNAKKWKRQGKS